MGCMVVDFDRGIVPLNDKAVLIPNGDGLHQVPAVVAVVAPQTKLKTVGPGILHRSSLGG